MFRKIEKNNTAFAALLNASLLLGVSGSAAAVVDFDVKDFGFVTDPSELKASMVLPLTDHVEPVVNTSQNILARAKRSGADPRIEALQIKIPANTKELVYFVKKHAKAQKTSELYDYLAEKLFQTKSPIASDNTKKVAIDAEGIAFFNQSSLAAIFEKPHHNIQIDAKSLKDDRKNMNSLMSQIQDFLPPSQRNLIAKKLSAGDNLSLDQDLLPEFAKRMVKTFLAYKGPNCFHAALAFHGEALTRSQYVNVKREEGYHSAMINYDELWRAIKAYFYEVNVSSSPLKYGDMIVFFELPKDADSQAGVNYRWIRHATTYLLGNYTFSKGSKSPDTPYTVKTLEDEWKTWQGYSQNLGVKVFRRSTKSAKKIPPIDLVDWVY